jgi:hypothetical protein
MRAMSTQCRWMSHGMTSPRCSIVIAHVGCRWEWQCLAALRLLGAAASVRAACAHTGQVHCIGCSTYAYARQRTGSARIARTVGQERVKT